jgi:hypothetical protein
MHPHNSSDPSPERHKQNGAFGPHPPRATSFSLSGLDRQGMEFASSLASLCLLVHNRRQVSLDAATREIVRELDILEYAEPYPAQVIQRGFPFYPSDLARHEELGGLEEKYKDVKAREAAGVELARYSWPKGVDVDTPWSYKLALGEIAKKIDEGSQTLRKRAVRGVQTPEGRVRSTLLGELLIEQLSGKPADTGHQVVRLMMRLEQDPWFEHIDSKCRQEVRHFFLYHVAELWEIAVDTNPNKSLRITSFNRHLRKLGVALLERSISFLDKELDFRSKQVLAEGHVDTYLAGTSGRLQRSRHAAAYGWLQKDGQHCPVPYPSWQPISKEECFNESFKIVTRARHHSYHSFNRLRLEARAMGGEEALLREFAAECFEDYRYVRCDNADMPPGRGTLMSGAITHKLFHSLDSSGDSLRKYENNEDLWFSEMVRTLEGVTVVPLRGWIAVTSDAPAFTVRLHKDLEPERYFYVVDNDHFSGSYGFAYGIPARVLARKVHPCCYGPDESYLNVSDLGERDASVAGLIRATIAEGRVPLTLGSMSPLFGGMCNAIPPETTPVFAYEEKQQSQAWRDIADHVHWSWMVWSYRGDRKAVDEAVKPLQIADHQIRDFAVAGQKLFQAIRHRYGAWKNDQTPGVRTAPRMLVRAYDIYDAHRRRGAKGQSDEPMYIGVTHRDEPQFNPRPVLDCHTLELLNGESRIQLPKDSDGTKEREISLWRRYVKPLIQARGKDGIASEGVYELVLMGENDLRRR